MNHATSFERVWRSASSGLFRMAHGSLLALGLVAVVFIGSGRLDGEQATSFNALVSEANAAETPVVVAAPAAKKVSAKVVEEDVTLSREMARVRDWVSRRYKVSTVALEPVLLAAEESGRHVGIDPLLIVAVMAIESSFNPFAESSMDKIGDERGEDALFDPELNVRVGTLVLQEGLRRYGSMKSALQYYGGALSDPAAAYARKVMAMQQRLTTAAGRKSDGAA